MANANDPNYYVKLLNLLIRINGGSIRIPANHLTKQDIGSGFNVYWDDSKSELVLEAVVKGAQFHEVKAGTSWTNQPLSPSVPVIPSALLAEDLLKRAWTEAAATPTVEEARLRPQSPQAEDKKNKVLHLTDETMGKAETKRRQEELLREIIDFQSPEPPSRSPREREVFQERERTQRTPSSAIPATFLRR